MMLVWIAGSTHQKRTPSCVTHLKNRHDVALQVAEMGAVFVQIERMLEGVHGEYTAYQAGVPSEKL